MNLAERQRRAAYANLILTKEWGVTFWTRGDQIEAFTDGWAMQVWFGPARIKRSESMNLKAVFNTDEEAIAHVRARADQGSELHIRALGLHVAAVLTKE